MKKQSPPLKPMTEVELEIMQLIWNLEPCTVREIHQALASDRELAYTSVATMVKILEQKSLVISEKSDRAHLFRALISKAEYESASLKHLAKNVFNNNPTSMVARLIDETELSREELSSIKKLLDGKLKQ